MITLRKNCNFMAHALSMLLFSCIFGTQCYSDVYENALEIRDPTIEKKESTRINPSKIGWVDPFDMLGENSHLGDLYTLSDVQSQTLKHRLEFCEIHLSRFVNLLRRAIETQVSSMDTVSLVKLEFVISEKELTVLKEFEQNKDRIERVSEVLNNIFTQSLYDGSNKQSKSGLIKWLQDVFTKILRSPEWTLFVSVSTMLLGTLWLIYKTRSCYLAIITLLLVVFFAGFGFTWMRMYEEEEIKKYYGSVQYSNAPYHCTGNPMQWYEHMYYRMFGVDCVEFYKIRDIRPMVKISPTEVFAETISTMFIGPATNIGKAYGGFITSVHESVSWWLQPIAVICAFLIPLGFTFVLLIFVFGYRISLSLTGFHIMPSWHRRDKAVCCKHDCKYVEDLSRKENESFQKNSKPQSLPLDDKTPMFLVNWQGMKKLMLGVGVKEDESNDDNQNKPDNEKDDSESAQERKASEGLMTSTQKQIESGSCKKRSRSILTVGEGSSSTSNCKEDMKEINDRLPVHPASGDHT